MAKYQKIILWSVFTLSIFAYTDNQLVSHLEKEEGQNFIFATWTSSGKVFDQAEWHSKLQLYDSLGISEVLVGGNPNHLDSIIIMANNLGIKIHAWMWTLNRPNDTIANKHPQWYSVNRRNQNSLDYRAYVDYYQWLSPFHPEAREYIKENVRRLAKIKGLASIHLDYVRYVDVILGDDLQPKYGLVQDTEMPEYDYGYHPIARDSFKAMFGVDPIEMEHPELSTEWRQFRLNAVTTLVNELSDIAHDRNQKISAAVFPFPEMSRQMVRQAWDDWNLDVVFPMLYHNFYRQNINWIGFSAEQGIRSVDCPLVAGLYMPGFKNAEELERAIYLVHEKGAAGVSFFTADGMSKELKAAVMKAKKSIDSIDYKKQH